MAQLFNYFVSENCFQNYPKTLTLIERVIIYKIQHNLLETPYAKFMELEKLSNFLDSRRSL